MRIKISVLSVVVLYPTKIRGITEIDHPFYLYNKNSTTISSCYIIASMDTVYA